MTPWEEPNVRQDMYTPSPKAGLSPSRELVEKSERLRFFTPLPEDEKDIDNIVHSLPSDLMRKSP